MLIYLIKLDVVVQEEVKVFRCDVVLPEDCGERLTTVFDDYSPVSVLCFRC